MMAQIKLELCFLRVFISGCSTKAGFIADDIADNLLVKTEKYGGISKGDIVGGNCIHPNCLKASLSRSLVALHIGSVSAYSPLSA